MQSGICLATLEMGIGVELCWPYQPRQKGSVENLVRSSNWPENWASLRRPLMAAQEQKFPAGLLDQNPLRTADRLATVQRIFKSVYDCVFRSLHPLVPSSVVLFPLCCVVVYLPFPSRFYICPL